MSTFVSKNPVDGAIFKTYPAARPEEIEAALARTESAADAWRNTSFEARAQILRRAATLLETRAAKYARLMTSEMGKPLGEAEGEVKKCAWVCHYFADNAEAFLSTDCVESDASMSRVDYEPLGCVLAIMPWNFPFWQVFRFAAPTLMAGNVALLKHAPNVPGCAEAIAEILDDAGLPEGVFQNLFIEIDDVETVIASPRVHAVTLTGSVGAGRSVASIAGRYLKPALLELGGSDPFIVLADADLDEAVERAVFSRTLNGGQSCIAAKRFIVEAPVYDLFLRRLAEAFDELVVGPPEEAGTNVGPMAREDLAETLRDQIRRSIASGAELKAGGDSAHVLGGCFVSPTVLGAVRPGMAAFDEETFGPCAAVARAADVEEAIVLANQTTFGLGASVWTSRDDVESIVRSIDAGNVFVNGIVKSDPRLPFGGIKDSGYGRELSKLGIHAFVNAKTVWIR